MIMTTIMFSIDKDSINCNRELQIRRDGRASGSRNKLLLSSQRRIRRSRVRCNSASQQYVKLARANYAKFPIAISESTCLASLHANKSHSAASASRVIIAGKLNKATVSSLISFLAALISITVLLAIQAAHPVEGVDCFKCASRNGSNPACEDPFHNLNSTRVTTAIMPDPMPDVVYHSPCYAGKKGRDGLFPASACIKLTGKFDITGETLVVRHCALDSGTLTQDTELARMSHCGKFQFEGDLLKGCVLACPEDACNSAPKVANAPIGFIPLLAAFCAIALLSAAPSSTFTS